MSALVVCPECADNDIDLIANLPTGQKRVECRGCGAVWVHGERTVEPTPRRRTFTEVKRMFPTPAAVTPEQMERVASMKAAFLATVQVDPQPDVAPYWARYQRIFSAEDLATCDPQDLKDFANNDIGARPGNMSVFNNAWNELGAEQAAERTREVIEYLLRGPESVPLEDRLTTLIDVTSHREMVGFKEALLTRVLCIMQPERFLTLLTYSGNPGKREIARSVYGLELPHKDKVTWTIGRLILWSNDLLISLIGEGFETQQHAAHFLWWAKDRA